MPNTYRKHLIRITEMNEIQTLLVTLIRNVVCGDAIPNGFSVTDSAALYDIARKHDMTHIVGYAIERNHLIVDDFKKYELQYLNSIRRVLSIERDLLHIKTLFDDNKIAYIPLKGAVIRKLYPQSWMRVSSDIDILVRKESVERAKEVLIEQFGCRYIHRYKYHDGLYAPSGNHIELHFALTVEESRPKSILDRVWENSRILDSSRSEYEMDDEYLYFYHIYHASKHFKYGGCGVRVVLDTWLLNHRVEYNPETRLALLQEGGLHHFSMSLEEVADKWFSCVERNGNRDVEKYILEGGLTGESQYVAAKQAIDGSRKLFVLKRLFPNYNSMKYVYPKLNNLPILLPFFWIYRIIKSIATGKLDKARYELQKSREDQEKSQEIKDMFEKLQI